MGGFERIEVVRPRIPQDASCGRFGFLGFGAAKSLESVAKDASQGLLNDVARDVSGRVKGPFALAAANFRPGLFDLRRRGNLDWLVQIGLEFLKVIDRLFENVAQYLDVDQPGIRDDFLIRDRRGRRKSYSARSRNSPKTSSGIVRSSRTGSSANRPPLYL